MSSGHTFQLLYFASASSYTHRESDTFQAPLPLKDLFSVIESRYSGITENILKSCAVTINLEYVDIDEKSSNGDIHSDIIIQAGDEVAIIPPVSSG